MDPTSHTHHHHRLHLRLDPGHHHRIHIHLCHHTNHLLPTAPCAAQHHHHQQQALVPPHSFPYPPTAAPWYPGGGSPAGPQGEAARDSEEPAPLADLYLEEEEEEEVEEPVFVLTDEWAEFFAKADAKRKLAKQQQQRKNRKK